MSWLISGTVPNNEFPLCMGKWRVDGAILRPLEVWSLQAKGPENRTPVPSVPVNRGTPALAASAILAAEALGIEPPSILLAGDCGDSKGSMELYDFLTSFLRTEQSAKLEGMTFHYLFPSVDGHNRIIMALDVRCWPRPVLIADAGFMYAAKMSGYADRWDVFTPDAGELAFLADEKAPHPFYTRGFLLADDLIPSALARLAHEHGDSSRILLIKGSTDRVVVEGDVVREINSPSIPFMEPIGGTGDLVTGLLTAFAGKHLPLDKACILAAQAARFTGEAAVPTPATSVADIIPFIPEGIRHSMKGNNHE